MEGGGGGGGSRKYRDGEGVGDNSGSDSKVIEVKGHDLSAGPLNQKVLARPDSSFVCVLGKPH